MTFEDLVERVESWASDRGILDYSSPQTQLMKTVSEMGELADATLKHDRDGVIDGVGDVLVTLAIYARLQGVTLTECLQSAYDVIKSRRGRLTPEGIFVKEEEDHDPIEQTQGSAGP
jgi:NTP pyrophosphatase (non-canonical NTP hydrolase)